MTCDIILGTENVHIICVQTVNFKTTEMGFDIILCTENFHKISVKIVNFRATQLAFDITLLTGTFHKVTVKTVNLEKLIWIMLLMLLCCSETDVKIGTFTFMI